MYASEGPGAHPHCGRFLTVPNPMLDGAQCRLMVYFYAPGRSSGRAGSARHPAPTRSMQQCDSRRGKETYGSPDGPTNDQSMKRRIHELSRANLAACPWSRPKQAVRIRMLRQWTGSLESHG
jgi:hypothetical protein